MQLLIQFGSVILWCLSLGMLAKAQVLPDPLSPRDLRRQAKGEAMVTALSHRLIADHDSTADQVEAIYDWVTHHIRFAKHSHLHFKTISHQPYRTLHRRRALALGYATLVEALCDKAGIPAFTVLGHAKTEITREGMQYYHSQSAWNAVQVDGKWQLLDACWGQGPLGRRPQRFRKRLWERYAIPYLPKLAFRHRPTRDWLLVHPDTMLHSHIPVDPKWQLLDSAMILRDFEAVRDTVFPRLPNHYLAAIAKAETMTKQEAAVEEGENAKQFNPRDDFEWARARIQLGQVGLYKPPEMGWDTTLWRTSVLEMRAGKKLLVEWYRKLGTDHRVRMSGLNRFLKTAKAAISQTKGECRLMMGEYRNHRRYGRRVAQMMRNEILTFEQVGRRIAGFRGKGDASPKPIKPALRDRLLAKEKAGLARISVAIDSLDGRVRNLEVWMNGHFLLSDSIEAQRGRTVRRAYDILQKFVDYKEKQVQWGYDTLYSLTRESRSMRSKRLRLSGKFWAQARALPLRSVKTMRQFEAAHGILVHLYRKGMPLDSVQMELKVLNDRYAAWKQKRLRQIGVANIQYDLEWQHIQASLNLLAEASDHVEMGGWCAKSLWKRERRMQMRRFHANMKLAKHLHFRADQGIETMQRWIREAKIAARRH